MDDKMAPVYDLTSRLGNGPLRGKVALGMVAQQEASLQPPSLPTPERISPALWLRLVALLTITLSVWRCGLATEPAHQGSGSTPRPGAPAAALDELEPRIIRDAVMVSRWEDFRTTLDSLGRKP